MFGYVKTDVPNTYVKDTILYKAMYCGLCKGLGNVCGQKSRFLLNYDLTFLSLLIHNVMGVDVKIEKQRCVIHQIRKRPIAIPDELTKRIACLNVLLAYYKVCDDVIDNNKGKLKRKIFYKAYKKAKLNEPEIDNIIRERYKELLQYEKKAIDSIDYVSDPFGKMMQEIVSVLLSNETSEEILSLSYGIGKWIYLIDAIDDYDKDVKNNNYNVFKFAYPSIKTKENLIKDKQQDLMCIFGAILSDIALNAKNINYKFNHDLIDNILYRGLVLQTKTVMENKNARVLQNTKR